MSSSEDVGDPETTPSEPPDPSLSRFAANLRRLREDARMSQKKLGNKIGANVGQIGRWEAAEANPDLRYLTALARFFNISVDTLVGLQAGTPLDTAETMAIVTRLKELLKDLGGQIEINFIGSAGEVGQFVYVKTTTTIPRPEEKASDEDR